MPIKIHPLTNPTTEIPTITSILSTTFAAHRPSPLVDALYPHHDTPRGRAAAVASLTREYNNNPKTRFLMAVDEGSGEVVGMAVWEVFGGEGGGGFDGVGEEKGGLKAEGEGGKGKGRLGEGPWDSEEEKGFAEGLYGELLRQREGFLRGRGGRGVVLTFLSVLPAHQRRGAGSQLIKWGTDFADRMGVDTVLEATKAGVPVYTKHGFQTEFQMSFTYPVRFADRKKPELTFMCRRRRGGVGDEK